MSDIHPSTESRFDRETVVRPFFMGGNVLTHGECDTQTKYFSITGFVSRVDGARKVLKKTLVGW